MKISIVTPTYERERFLPALYDSFCAQTYPDLELLVGDDSTASSAFFSRLSDPRVRYVHFPARLSTGEKRNRLIASAAGEVIVFFDDDDYYAPHYVETMVKALHGADLVKLVGWYVLWAPARALFYWDTTSNHPTHFNLGKGSVALVSDKRFGSDFVAKNVDGYGFSYVFRRSALEKARFPDLTLGEDLPFVTDLRRAGGTIVHVADECASAVHILHGLTSSVVFPQYRLPPAVVERLFPGLAAHLARANMG